MLEWSERWRAVALAVPSVRPPADEVLQADLAALRDVTSRLARARDLGLPAAPLEHEQQRLERAVRGRALHSSTRDIPRDGAAIGRAVDGGPLLDELGADRLVELLNLDGELHALVCGSGQVRQYVVGP